MAARVAQRTLHEGAQLVAQSELLLHALGPHTSARNRALPTEKLLRERQPASPTGQGPLELVESPEAALFVALLLWRLQLLALLLERVFAGFADGFRQLLPAPAAHGRRRRLGLRLRHVLLVAGRGSDGDAVHDELDTLAACEARSPADILPVPCGQAAAPSGCCFGYLIAHLVRRLEDDRSRQTKVSAKDLLSGSLL